MHNPIYISELTLQVGHKICFSDFSYTIYHGEKIAIIGDNGSGKSSLLKLIAQLNNNYIEGISSDNDIISSYVPQIIDEFTELSGGQRFNKALSIAMANYPNLLLLDEPTNHLDRDNRQSLMKLLKNHPATQIIVSHDVELLDSCVDTLWHIHDGRVSIYNGKYSLYQKDLQAQKQKLVAEIKDLKNAKTKEHQMLMKEQVRAKNSRLQGEKHIKERKWPTITSGAKARRSETTSGKNTAGINQRKEKINDQLNQLWQPEEISYSFSLSAKQIDRPLVTINNGSCGYLNSPTLLEKINLNIFGGERICLAGSNGSGKSTLVKAIMQNEETTRNGEWIIPNPADIAYLDQHYSNLTPGMTILQYIKSLNPKFNDSELRVFLNQFLFRKNEEVNNLVNLLSGGEKARLSLAAIAIREPKLLILDEVTNNIDLTTKDHITQVLKGYPGAMIVISHDNAFLQDIGINNKTEVSLWRSNK